MKTFEIFAATLLVLSLVLVTFPASATTVSECKNLIGLIRADLLSIHSNGGIQGGNPEQTFSGLDSKLTGAQTKLDQYKAEDAIQKLTQFSNKVQDLIYEGKIFSVVLSDLTEVTPQMLIDGAQDAIECVYSLIDQALEQELTPAAKGKPTAQSAPVTSTTQDSTTQTAPAPDTTVDSTTQQATDTGVTQDTTTVSEPTTSVTGISSTP